VVVLAHEEARTLRHGYIGTEHILLGLLREKEGLAARVLESLDVTVELVRTQVLRIVSSGDEPTAGQIPFTARGKRVLELSLNEALSLGHNYIGTEHILLGLVGVNDGAAARVLLGLDADPEKIRSELIRMLSGPEARQQARSMSTGSHETMHAMDQAWFDGLGAVLNGLAREIRRHLQREPDTGDLLLALACAPDTRAAQTLRELGVNIDELPGVIERVRAQRAPEQQVVQRGVDAVVAPEVIQEFCRHLGIPSRTDDPPQPPEQS
jgi:ATP-dependent Clp protease ATP-binding subunit ClpA